jgi:hypothetical protein
MTEHHQQANELTLPLLIGAIRRANYYLRLVVGNHLRNLTENRTICNEILLRGGVFRIIKNDCDSILKIGIFDDDGTELTWITWTSLDWNPIAKQC